jgi:TRAP-type C4-dicarboxylate transport system substrate-binding protein
VTRHVFNPQALIVSKKFWDTLSAEEKKIFEEAATEATAFQRQVNRKFGDEALEALKKAGMQVSEFSPGELEKMREKVKPVVQKYSAQVGEETVKEVYAEISKVRK